MTQTLQTQQIKVELLTEDAFRPFGDVVALRSQPPDFHGTGLGTEGWNVDFFAASTTRVAVINGPYHGMRFSKLERHHNVTQTFIPLGGSPCIIAFAPPTDPSHPDDIPDPSQVRAFIMDGTKGYMMKRGTWHSLDRHPLYPPGCQFVILTDLETADELEQLPRDKWRLTEDVDYTDRFGITFELTI
jgi:ureidoglycolate lyase